MAGVSCRELESNKNRPSSRLVCIIGQFPFLILYVKIILVMKFCEKLTETRTPLPRIKDTSP